MPAYVIAWLTVNDPERMAPYRAEAPEVLARYGGKYVSVGPGTEALEGDWSADGMAILEFPSREAAIEWYESPEYRPLRELRQDAADTVILVSPEQPAVR